MYYIGNVVKSVAGLYNNINSATLTGAIDIIVVKQEDGLYVGSPFHVRFGKLGVLSSREKVVEIAINDMEVDLQMKLGTAGEAFFVEETLKENMPQHLCTSPIPEPMSMIPKSFSYHEIESPVDNSPKKDYDANSDGTKKDSDINSDENLHQATQVNIDIELTPAAVSPSQSIPIPGKWQINDEDDLEMSNMKHLGGIPYALSDMDSPISSPLSSSPYLNESYIRQISSDTEVATPLARENEQIKWEWGMLPEATPTYSRENITRPRRKSLKRKETTKSDALEGLLIDEALAADKEVADMYFNRTGKEIVKSEYSEGLLLDEVFAADKEVADMYLNRTNSAEDFFSEFGGENGSPKSVKDESPLGEHNKDILDDMEPRDVAFSLCGGLKDRKVSPDKFLEFLVSYEEFCLNPGILHNAALVIRINERYYNWSVAAPYLLSYMLYQKALSADCLRKLIRAHMPKKRRGWFQWRAPPDDPESSDEERHIRINNDEYPISNTSDNDEFDSDIAINISKKIEFIKTLRLTSEQWSSLKLDHGANKVTFTVTTRNQGTASCDARIFLWDYSDKIVISDIDGTITKSDVLGQLLPAVGKDWSQIGVTGLFTKIKHNGYNFMYLSARAIGQAQTTRDFLQSVKQGELTLPDGPVLLTPTSLFKAFKKEVIERKPEEFKISCMRDIRGLYSEDSNPFYSGFGNRVNDVWAYRAVGIPISRVFTINYKGEIKHELTNTFSSSYSKLLELVDQMFPPLSSKTVDSSESDFTSFSFWRTPIAALPEIAEEDMEDIDIP